MKLVLFFLAITVIGRSTLAVPAAKGENHFGRVTVDIRDITDKSAVIDWIVPADGKNVDSFKVSCVELSTVPDKQSVLEFFASQNANSLLITDLKSDTKYSCSLLIADEKGDDGWSRLMEPMEFTTHQSNKDTHESSPETALTSFKDTLSQNLVLLLPGILIPVFLLAACVGGFVIWRKVKAFKNGGNDYDYEQLKSSRFGAGIGSGSQPRNDLNEQLNRHPPKDTEKSSDSIRAKYQLPSRAQTTPSPLTISTGPTPPKSNTGLLYSPRRNEKAMSPKEFDQALMKIHKTDDSFEEPRSDDDTMSCVSSESEISLPSLISPAALSAPTLPYYKNGVYYYTHYKADLPRWTNLPQGSHLHTLVTLDDILPPIPPPSENDIVV